MRKLFPAIVLLAALLVVAFVAYLARSGSPTASTPLPTAPGAHDARESTEPVAPTPLATPGNRAEVRSSAAEETVASPAQGPKLERQLRVIVRVDAQLGASAPDARLPDDLEVGTANGLGVVFEPQREGDSHFVFRSLRAGTYVVVAKASGFATEWRRVDVKPELAETTIEVVLKRARVVRVRWSTEEGLPIVEALRAPAPAVVSSAGDRATSPDGRVTLTAKPDGTFEAAARAERGPQLPLGRRVGLSARVSRVVPPEFGPLHPSTFVAIWSRYLVLDRKEDGSVTLSGAPWIALRPQPADPSQRPPEDTFALLAIDEPGRVFVSVWHDDVRVDGAWLEPDQSEVAFRSASSAFHAPWARVRARVVEDAGGRPIDRASALVDSSNSVTTDVDGLVEILVPPGDRDVVFRAADHDDVHVPVRARSGAEFDLGDVRLSPTLNRNAAPEGGYQATFRVVDASGAPADVHSLALVRLADWDGMGPLVVDGTVRQTRRRTVATSGGPAGRAQGADESLVTFTVNRPDKYVLLSTVPTADVEPFLLDVGDFSRDSDRVVGEVVVRMPRIVSFRFREPPSPGTQIVIETPAGWPVAVLDTNEYGVVQTWLGPRSYRMHLVEDGTKTDSLAFKVDTDPFLFDILR